MTSNSSETTKSGNFVSGAGLQPTSAGARVRLKSGKITLMDGPLPSPRESDGANVLLLIVAYSS
jgi:hypothetical protein